MSKWCSVVQAPNDGVRELGTEERRFGIMEWGVIKRVKSRQKGD